MTRPRIGVVGYGYIGRELVRRAAAADSGIDVAFVYNRSAAALDDLDDGLVLESLADAGSRRASLIVETAHPDISVEWGVEFIRGADYMPLSTTALVDDDLRSALLAAGEAAGHGLYLAAGALVGGASLASRPEAWERVKITFRKNPANLDLSASGIDPDSITAPTTIFSGSARGVARRFPRNVNTMVTGALLSVGLDRCECEVVADPTLDRAVAEVEAWGYDGGHLRTDKRQPAVGVSGTEMLDSVWYSVRRAVAADGAAMRLV